MTTIRLFLCDDEPLALERLEGLLQRTEAVEVVGTSLGGEGAIEEIGRLDPDLVLLDIEMPKLDGFDIVDGLSRRDWGGKPPLIVFVTAHPGYAFEAFESGALDFISKPVRLHRLERAVARARAALAQRQAAQRLASLMENLEELRATAAKPPRPRYIWVQKGSERVRLGAEAVETIEAEGEYVRLHTHAGSYLHRGPLGLVGEQLGADTFLRIHRSTIINHRFVAGLTRRSWGGVAVRMRSGRCLPVGRSYQQAVRALLSAE